MTSLPLLKDRVGLYLPTFMITLFLDILFFITMVVAIICALIYDMFFIDSVKETKEAMQKHKDKFLEEKKRREYNILDRYK